MSIDGDVATSIEVTVDCSIFDSFRVQQVAGLFDVPLTKRASVTFRVDLPELGDEWRIGLIVGPSGSGKSTIAKRLFGDAIYQGQAWPDDRAVIDCLGDQPIKQIVQLFTAVGFSSPPSWVKPYQVLSNGERFRCDLVRALIQGNVDDLVVFDEFTSVVDRNVAKIGSAAIAKGIEKGNILRRFVAVTCHYDVAEWLQPNWMIDMATSTFSRRCLRRPSIELQVFHCKYTAWRLFARHHYLSASLHKAAQCYMTTWNDEPVAFCAVMPLVGFKGRRRISRLVTLPDYQGIGIGAATLNAVASLHKKCGQRVSIITSHPAMISHLKCDSMWRCTGYNRRGCNYRESFGSKRNMHKHFSGAVGQSQGRAVASFEYMGD